MKLGSISLFAPSNRIPSIDFWRGAYLLMIYVNHIPDNLLSFLTLRNWGFADSAEAFVFISGFSAMLAFGRYFEIGGFGIGLLRTGKRVWQLFCAHLLLVFVLAVVIAAAGTFTDNQPFMREFNFTPLFYEIDIALLKMFTLGYLPNLTDILPLYIVLIFLFPVAWMLIRKSSVLAIGASFLLWLWVNVTDNSVANYPPGIYWFFNPWAWQLIFVAGMVTFKERERLGRWAQSRILFWVALFIVGASLLAIAPWTQFKPLAEYRLVPQEYLSIDNKSNLAWIRLLHFAALALVGVRLFPGDAKFWKYRVVKAVALCGQHSLSIFWSGTVLSLVMHIVIKANHYGTTVSAAIAFSGVLLLVLLASSLQKAKELLGKVSAKKIGAPTSSPII